MASRSYEIKNVLTRDGYLARVLKFDSNSNLYTVKHFNTNTVEFLDNSQFRPFHNISNYSFAEVDYTQKCKELLRRDYEDMFQEGSMEYVNIPGSVDPEQGSRPGGRGRTTSTKDILADMKKATKDQQIRREILRQPADDDDDDDDELTGQQLEIFGGSEDESESDTSSSASSSSASSSSSSDDESESDTSSSASSDEGASFNFDKKSYTLMKKALKKKAKRDKLEMAMGLQIRTLSSKKPYTFRMID